MIDYIFRLQLEISRLCVLAVPLTVALLWFIFELKDVLIFVTGVMVWLTALMSTIYLMFADENDFYVFEVSYKK